MAIISETQVAAFRRGLVLPLFSLILGLAVPAVASDEVSSSTLSSPSVPRSGKLPNGLAYYLEKTTKPGVQFSLVIRVGSVQSRPASDSAHVLEHIIIEKLSDIGRKGTLLERVALLGGFRNGATGENQTTYYVNFPNSDAEAVASGLDILSDWVSAGPISDDEIDREIKVVTEEARRGLERPDTESRKMATWFAGHPMLERAREPAGAIKADAATIRELHRIYDVPSNMAVVITGNIDPDVVFREISNRLGRLAPGGVVPPRLTMSAPDLKGGHYLPMADTETVVEISYKLRPAAVASGKRARDLALARLLEKLARQGFANLAEREGAPLSFGSLSRSSLYGQLFTTDMLIARAAVRRGEIRDALIETARLVATVRHHGFPIAAIEQARSDLLRETKQSSEQEGAERWVELFAKGEAPPSEAEIRGEIARLSSPAINRALANWLDPVNRDIFITYTERDKASVPPASEIPALMAKAERGPPVDFLPPVVRVPSLAVVPSMAGPAPAAIDEANGVKRWTLPRSGATLLFRRVEGATARLLMRRPGGLSRYSGPTADIARTVPDILGRSGLGGLSNAELYRYLSSYRLTMGSSARPDFEQMSVTGPGNLWPTMLGLARSRMSQPQCRKTALDDFVYDLEGRLDPEAERAIDARFDQMFEKAIGRQRLVDIPDLAALRIEDICAHDKATYATASGMTIVVEGPLSTDAVYAGVASMVDIPSTSAEPPIQAPSELVTQAGRTVLHAGSKPLARVRLAMATLGNGEAGQLIGEILNVRLFKRLRTVEKGTYDVMAGLDPDEGLLTIQFDCAPENVDRLVAAAKQEIERMRRDGPSDSELSTARTAVGDRKINADWIADNWIERGSLTMRPAPTDAGARSWAKEQLLNSRLHEFVRLPEAASDGGGTAVKPAN